MENLDVAPAESFPGLFTSPIEGWHHVATQVLFKLFSAIPSQKLGH